MSGFYDLMLLLDPTAPEERRDAAISEAESMINSRRRARLAATTGASGGWRTRSTTGPRRTTGSTSSTGDNALLERLNQRLRITDAVLRFRIIKVKPGQPTPPPPDQQAPRRRDEREPQDTKVAARAAADAPAVDEALADAPPARRRCRGRGRGTAPRGAPAEAPPGEAAGRVAARRSAAR